MNTDPSNVTEEHEMLDVDESTQVFPPPPHIAARFHRASKERHRSSAASSRRSSLSSAHSPHSHPSYPGVQSKHVAQHLRRASILESRRARLADRAAHAEQVRLRAAMAKSTPRASTLEERALAAEKQRQKYLDQVAASCAEEVRRAKRVAEEIKERREAEVKKHREDMEDKLAEAERRRIEYQKNLKRGRTISAARVDHRNTRRDRVTTMDQTEAALKIQHAWRTTRRRRIIKDFIDLGLSVEGTRNTSFEHVRDIITQETVIQHTTRVLKLCELQHADGDSITGLARTFLSAYMILGHPDEVLSDDDGQQQDFVANTEDLLISFERLLQRMTPLNNYTPPPAQVKHLTDTFNTFQTGFMGWKAQNHDHLLQVMLTQYVELDRMWQKIKTEKEEVVRTEYCDGIRQNQVLLLVRIKRLVGAEEGKIMVRDAIRASRKSSRPKKPAGDGGSVGNPKDSSISTTSEESNALLIPDNEPAIPSSDGKVDPVQVASLARALSIFPDNRTLTHEIALNREYRIPTDSIINSKPRAAVKQALFEAMRNDLKTGQDQTKWVVAIVVNIRSKLLRILTPGNPLHNLISEALDSGVIAQKCEMGSFSYEQFFSFMNSLLPKLCAPFRDNVVKALAENNSGDVIDRLSRLMHIIDLLSLDYVDYVMQQAVPRLVEEAPGYEERRFAQDLESGTISLQLTERWWTRAREQAFAEAVKRDPEGVNHASNKPSSGKIYMRGLTDLFISASELTDEDLPETLELDRERIIHARDDILRIIVVSSILLTAKNLLKRDVCSPWKAEATRIWEFLKENTYSANAASSIQTMLETSHALPAPTKAQLGSLIARIISQAQSRQLTDPVMRLLFHRLRTHVLTRLVASSTATSSDRARANNTASSERLAASGFSEFTGRIGDLAEEIRKVGDVDRASHGRWYEEIAQKADHQEMVANA
ncbi:MAG: hypothetical protein M1816_007956 [Peltula sp. TS41687]|nr:MAG: hypothetical protein M1816_007956 [Peltula sp. TS41687]